MGCGRVGVGVGFEGTETLGPMLPCLGGEQGEGGPFLLYRKHQPPSPGTLAAESVAVRPDLSEIKGTCGNPLPAKGESLGEAGWASGGSPLKCQQLKNTTQR